jgi:hypothetical protein
VWLTSADLLQACVRRRCARIVDGLVWLLHSCCIVVVLLLLLLLLLRGYLMSGSAIGL